MAEDSANDAEHLASHWGTAVAMAMLDEGAISPIDFIGLCAEAAHAADD